MSVACPLLIPTSNPHLVLNLTGNFTQWTAEGTATNGPWKEFGRFSPQGMKWQQPPWRWEMVNRGHPNSLLLFCMGHGDALGADRASAYKQPISLDDPGHWCYPTIIDVLCQDCYVERNKLLCSLSHLTVTTAWFFPDLIRLHSFKTWAPCSLFLSSILSQGKVFMILIPREVIRPTPLLFIASTFNKITFDLHIFKSTGHFSVLCSLDLSTPGNRVLRSDPLIYQ